MSNQPTEPVTTELSPTRKVLSAMLKENTGKRLTDSGDHYGRNYEANAGIDFEAQPSSYINIMGNDEFFVVHSLYHWLADRVEFDAEMQAKFDAFAEQDDNKNVSWFKLQREFPEFLKEQGVNVTGFQGEDVDEFKSRNTYNDENALSQNFEYVYFEVDDVPYAAIMVHGGCDATSGYTAPKLFKVVDPNGGDDDGSSIMFIRDVYLRANRPEGDKQPVLPGVKVDEYDSLTWKSEDAGYRWYIDDDGLSSHFRGEEGDLRKYPVSNDLALRGKGHVVIDEESKTVYCPLTGWELSPSDK